MSATKERPDARDVAADVIGTALLELLADDRVRAQLDRLQVLTETVQARPISDRDAWASAVGERDALLMNLEQATDGLLDRVTSEAVVLAYSEGFWRGEALAFSVAPSLPWPTSPVPAKRLRGEDCETVRVAVASWAEQVDGATPTEADDIAAGDRGSAAARKARERLRRRLALLAAECR